MGIGLSGYGSLRDFMPDLEALGHLLPLCLSREEVTSWNVEHVALLIDGPP